MPAQSNLGQEDRGAATAVTTSGSGYRFEMQLGHLCNNRCVFCSSGQLTAMKIARPVPIESIVEALEEARATGATHVTFLGGEPTIHKRFIEAVAKAVELGFAHIVIFTNGVMFSHPGFIAAVTALGTFEWRISIQGATDEAHVATTGRAESFRRILHGLGELQRRGQLVTANMCVNERSYRSLPQYPELLARYGVRQLHVDLIRPASAGERDEAYLRDIMPRYSDMAPYYATMLAGFERWDPDFDVNIGNLPHCILPAWASHIHHGGEETVTRSSGSFGLEDARNKYDWHKSLRTHLPGCTDCVFRSRCAGIFRVYLELYGEAEFRPVSRAALAAFDRERRNFVVLVEPFLVPLRAALAAHEAPSSWCLQQEISEDRLRRVEIVLAHETGGSLKLRFVVPPSGRQPVIRSQAYEVEAEADFGVPLSALATLLEWVCARLATALERSAAPALANDAIERALRESVMTRGRRRVAVLAGYLQSRFAHPGWSLERLRWPTDPRGDGVARGPGGGRVDLRFTLRARGRRAQVGIDFRPATASDQHSVEAVINELVVLLRAKLPVTAVDAAAR